MANTDNLKPVRSKEEARKRGKKGGKASGKARKEKKQIKQYIQAMYELDPSENNKQVMESLGIPEEMQNGLMMMVVSMYQKALKGDTKAFTTLMEYCEGKPVSEVEKAKIELDRAKLEIEKEKIAIERAKLERNVVEDGVEIIID